MGWFSSLFSSESSQYTRKGQALSSTHEAFSLPMSSPTFPPSTDTFHSDALSTPEPDSAMSPSYTYPPQGVYGAVPMSAGLTSRPTSASLLPTHIDPHTPVSAKFSYPPLSSTWNRIRIWLNREYPELGDTLNYGILPKDLSQIEMQFGFSLPAVVRESYLCVDGQEAESAAGCSEGLFFGLKLLPLEDVFEEWRFWREVDEDPSTGANERLREMMQSIPPGWVRREYSSRGWIPLIADKAGNYIGVDLNPGESGSVGQVIVFGRDFDTKVVLWRGDGLTGWAKWLASFAEELESGEGFEIGLQSEGSEGSEDDVGYESYFYDGSGRGQGDGGGDSGSGGGLRLTGDYRGWSVLEAFADRSVRRWHEAGVITDTTLLPVEEVQPSDLAPVEPSRGSNAETILTNHGEGIASPLTTGIKPVPPLPTISVTKVPPPAPLPVDLPTPHDIIPSPSPPESQHSSFDDDLEAGRSPSMREMPRDELHFVSSSKQSRPQSPTEEQDLDGESSAIPRSTNITDVPLSASPPSAEVVSAAGSALSSSPEPAVPDLLADSALTMETKPIAPSSPTAVQDNHADKPPVADVQEPSSQLDEEPPNEDPDTTIRLVGGGGISGPAFALEDEDSRTTDAETDTDAGSVASVASESKPQQGGKKHKKTRSGLAGLKKLSQLGRKKDSNSNVAASVSETPNAA